MIEAAGFQLEGADKIPLGPTPPLEPPTFGPTVGQAAPPPFQAPDFLDEAEAPPFEPPDWWDDSLSPPPFEEEPMEEPPFLDRELPALAQEPFPFRPTTVSADKRSGDRIRLRAGGVPLVISGGSFQEMLAVVKDIPGRRFNAEERVWEFPPTVSLESLGQHIAAAGFVLEQE
jgi:hypothetical protein